MVQEIQDLRRLLHAPHPKAMPAVCKCAMPRIQEDLSTALHQLASGGLETPAHLSGCTKDSAGGLVRPHAGRLSLPHPSHSCETRRGHIQRTPRYDPGGGG
jgi:hypothetical protein